MGAFQAQTPLAVLANDSGLYTQTGAFFFQREFTDLPFYRSSDADLGPFSVALFGFKFSIVELPIFTEGISEHTVGGNYWLRNDGMTIYWFALGYLVRF